MSKTPITDAVEASNPLFAVDGKRYWTIPSETARALEIAANGLRDAIDDILGEAAFEGLPDSKQEQLRSALANLSALQPKEPHE